jgi:hypothetical protein
MINPATTAAPPSTNVRGKADAQGERLRIGRRRFVTSKSSSDCAAIVLERSGGKKLLAAALSVGISSITRPRIANPNHAKQHPMTLEAAQ